MQITRLRTNHLENPLGFSLAPLSLTWQVEDTPSAQQTAARVEVASDAAFTHILHDTGRDAALDSLGFAPPLALRPRTRFWWRVTVWGDAGDSAISEPAFFETGKMDEPWGGQWIAPCLDDPNTHPYLRTVFDLPAQVRSARVYATGLGVYELALNGARVGSEHLAPACNAYDQWIQVQTYDVTDLLKPGCNALGAMLGNGWAKGRFGLSAHKEGNYCDTFGLLLELRATLADGQEVVVATEPGAWQAAPSPVLDSSIYDGETYDARRALPGWATAEFDAANWAPTTAYDPKLGALCDRLSPPIVVKEERAPVALLRTPAGETVLDMGQNMVGWVRFRTDAPAGTHLTLYHGELLQQENFFRTNLRSAKQEYHYMADGQAREVAPHFTFYGFRYVMLEGFTGPVRLEDFTGCVVYSDLERTGYVETSNPAVNRLLENVLWGQKGNFVDVPTDCPQRDERMGWTGDAQVFCQTALWNMDAYAFFTKFLHDLAAEQGKLDGNVPSVVPNVSPLSRPDIAPVVSGACGWADAATVMPWTVYANTGDPAILARQFESMRGWVDWIRRRDIASGDHKLWRGGFHFGDWLSMDALPPDNPFGGTNMDYLASAYYRHSAKLVAKAAAVLGKHDLAQTYHALSDAIAAAITNAFFTPEGRCAIPTQTAHAIALQFDLVPASYRARVLSDLVDLVWRDKFHLKTGFLGTPCLCAALSENGAHDAACRIFFQTDCPSWLYEVSMGATTIWERWNSLLPDGTISDVSMNSMNHYAYGAIEDWVVRTLCGIRPVEDAPGFRRVALRPLPAPQLTYARARMHTAMGWVESGWTRGTDGTLCVEVAVPFGAQASLVLPSAALTHVSAAGAPLAQGAWDAEQTEAGVHITLRAGRYAFTYPYTARAPYGADTPVGILLGDVEAPALLGADYEPMSHLQPHYLRCSARDFATDPQLASVQGRVNWRALCERLEKGL